MRATASFVPALAPDRQPTDTTSARRRSRVWELPASLHCSIVGTCVSTGELRQILARSGNADARAATDHDLHCIGVRLAGSREQGAKFLQKALDQRHRVAINQFAKAKDAGALRALWAEAVERGEIPGAYWAVLTHPAATDPLVKQAFGDVHMLSHLVGAANRADIRRLRQLQEENAALAAKLARQQSHLRDGFQARDETIRRLNDMIARTVGQPVAAPQPAAGPDDAARAVIADQSRRLAGETARCERLHSRVGALSQALDAAQIGRRRAEAERDALRNELAALEDRIGELVHPEQDAAADGIALAGRAILYVGGRAHQIPKLKAIVERLGARFLHHDGGIEHSATLLPGLVSRADLAAFPVDCVSHDAVAALKRLCRHAAKPYVPLRSASLACLSAALSALQREGEATPAPS